MKNVLIVEDDTVFCKMLSRLLNRNGFATFEALNAGEAKSIIDKVETVDFALIDQKLPDENGIQVLKFIKNRGHSTKVIMMSRFESPEQTEEFNKEGATLFLKKPINPKILMEQLNKM
ncbi:MAG: response regulator [Crocinitomicaceae bacterium]|nr:response regulator [Crocinitomicaceae bacterium]